MPKERADDEDILNIAYNYTDLLLSASPNWLNADHHL